MIPTEPENALTRFIEAAKSKGASDESLARLLEERGWSAKSIARAFASYYERVAGLAVPAAPRVSAESARDAFLYLLAFSTLGVWTVALGSVIFSLLDRWMPDRTAIRYYQDPNWILSGNLAAVLVAFPVFLLAARQIARDLASQPERYESGVRKWLTYLALFVAAGVAIGDLITFLAFFLRGELTGRFVLKAVTVLVLAGGVFWHYLLTLKPSGSRPGRKFAVAAAAAAAAGLILGFLALGSPAGRREASADSRRSEDLAGVARRIEARWSRDSKLPVQLGDLVPPGATLPERFLDPVTGQPYEYRPGTGARFDLCAVFATDTRNAKNEHEAYHPAGRYCYSLDASYLGPNPLGR